MNEHQAPVYRPNKRATYGTVKEVEQTTALEVGGVKRLAALARRKLSSTNSCLDPDHPSHLNFETICNAVSEGARRPVEYLAQRAKGIFVPIDPGKETLPTVLARSAVEHAEVVSSSLLALQDGEIRPHERAQIQREVDDTIRSLVTIRAWLGEGRNDV